MLDRGNAFWKKTKKTLLKPIQLSSTNEDGAKNAFFSLISRPPSHTTHVLSSEWKEPFLLLPCTPESVTGVGSASKHSETKGETPVNSVVGQSNQHHVTDDGRQGTGVLPIEAAARTPSSLDASSDRQPRLDAQQTRSGDPVQPLSVPSQNANASFLPTLREGKQPPQLPRAKIPPSPSRATESAPKTTNEEFYGYTMLNRMMMGSLQLVEDTKSLNSPDHRNMPRDRKESVPVVLTPLPQLTLTTSLPDGAFLSVPQPSETLDSKDKTENNRPRGGPNARLDSGASYVDDINPVQTHTSPHRGEKAEAATKGSHGTATKPPLWIGGTKNGRATDVSTSRPWYSTARVVPPPRDSADVRSSQHRNSNEASNFSRSDHTSLFNITSSDHTSGTLTEYYKQIPSTRSTVKRGSLLSFPSTKLSSLKGQMSFMYPKACEEKDCETPNAEMGNLVQRSIPESLDGVHPHLAHEQDVVECSVDSETLAPSVLRRARELPPSRWKYVAMVVRKVEAVKNVVRASRTQPQRTSSGQHAPELSEGPQGHEQGDFFHCTTPPTPVSSHTSSEGCQDTESDEEEVSVYGDEDGKLLMALNTSELWTDYYRSSESHNSFILCETGATGANHGRSHRQRRGSNLSAASMQCSSQNFRPVSSTTVHVQSDPSQATDTSTAEAVQQSPAYDVARSGGGTGRHMHARGNPYLSPDYQYYVPDRRLQHPIPPQEIVDRQRQLLFHQQQQRRHYLPTRGYQSHMPTPYLSSPREQRGPTESSQDSQKNTKNPEPQPDIYSGRKVYRKRSDNMKLIALAGVRLSDARYVDSPNWQSLKLQDRRAERKQRGKGE